MSIGGTRKQAAFRATVQDIFLKKESPASDDLHVCCEANGERCLDILALSFILSKAFRNFKDFCDDLTAEQSIEAKPGDMDTVFSEFEHSYKSMLSAARSHISGLLEWAKDPDKPFLHWKGKKFDFADNPTKWPTFSFSKQWVYSASWYLNEFMPAAEFDPNAIPFISASEEWLQKRQNLCTMHVTWLVGLAQWWNGMPENKDRRVDVSALASLEHTWISAGGQEMTIEEIQPQGYWIPNLFDETDKQSIMYWNTRLPCETKWDDLDQYESRPFMSTVGFGLYLVENLVKCIRKTYRENEERLRPSDNITSDGKGFDDVKLWLTGLENLTDKLGEQTSSAVFHLWGYLYEYEHKDTAAVAAYKKAIAINERNTLVQYSLYQQIPEDFPGKIFRSMKSNMHARDKNLFNALKMQWNKAYADAFSADDDDGSVTETEVLYDGTLYKARVKFDAQKAYATVLYEDDLSSETDVPCHRIQDNSPGGPDKKRQRRS
jgi:hypothetical protein